MVLLYQYVIPQLSFRSIPYLSSPESVYIRGEQRKKGVDILKGNYSTSNQVKKSLHHILSKQIGSMYSTTTIEIWKNETIKMWNYKQIDP